MPKHFQIADGLAAGGLLWARSEIRTFQLARMSTTEAWPKDAKGKSGNHGL